MAVDWTPLIQAALGARQGAYAPYSKFLVGAALLSDDDDLYTGCNVENASYGLTVCAERVAFFRAVASGDRHFVALVVASDTSPPALPCGACRQVLRELAPDLPIRAVNASGDCVETTLSRLLPDSFGPDTLIASHTATV
ncbi:MAG: cytidine deaminase [Alphaproteobacteria bacterium]|nr:cytidine deaminase [Alphaproteobacteria bacterium]